MAIEGSLETFNLPEILQMISAQDKTGILTVQGENDIVAVSFKGGQVVGADALNQTVEEGLGQVLASQGMVSPADFSEISEEHERTGKRLLDLLTERGLLERSQLLEALRLQTYQLLLQLLRWEDGEFKFYSGDEVAYEEGFYAISVEELLVRSVSDLGEGQGSQLPELDVAYRKTGGPQAVKILGVDGDLPAPADSAVWLDPEEKQLWDRLDGSRTARELAASTQLGEYKVLFALYRLLSSGAVKPIPPQAPEVAEVPPPPIPGPVPAPPATAPSEPPPLRPRPVASPEASPAVLEVPREEVLPAEPPAEPPRVRREVDLSWIRRGVPLVAAAGVAAVLLSAPFTGGLGSALVLPFPWQSEIRESLDVRRLQSHYQRIDRNARVFFLLEGHYPDRLDELVDLRLLGPEDLRDPEGRPLAYRSDDVSYLLQPVQGGALASEPPVREAITGDFLLDPDFLELPDEEEQAPLVLLD